MTVPTQYQKHGLISLDSPQKGGLRIDPPPRTFNFTNLNPEYRIDFFSHT